MIWQVLKSVRRFLMSSGAENRHCQEVMEAREPSVVDRLAAIGDPSGEAARRIALWEEKQVTLARVLAGIDASAKKLAQGLD